MFSQRIDRMIVNKIPKCDKLTISDPHHVSEYAEDIHSNMLDIEEKYQPTIGMMKMQKDATDNMRSILVDWLIDVCLKFKLLPESLFLTVNIIDRYLSRA